MPKYKYICFRIFIVPLEGHLFYKPAEQNKKISWFKESFLRNLDLQTKRGADFAIRITKTDDSFIFGKLSKRKTYSLHDKTPNDIKEVSVEDWPYLGFICDISKNQLLILQYDSAIIYKIASISEILSELANQRMFEYGYAVSFEPIVREDTFWNIVDSAEAIYSLSFSFKSPNLFGATTSADESLKELQKLFNNNKTDVTLINEKGKLTIPKTNVETYRDYADKGGGNWKITVQKNKKKRSYNSTERAIRITIDTEEKAGENTLKQALTEFLKQI